MKNAIRSCFQVAKKNKFLILGIILVPFLYAILYVQAFWNPVEQLGDMEIAIVNMDKGTTYLDEDVNYGETIVDSMKDDDTVIWVEEDPSLFTDGIENTEYQMAFVIDKNFSENVMAASDGEPKQGRIIYLVDKRKNFVISQYGNMIKSAFETRVSESISKEYTDRIYGGLRDMAESMETAADGTQKLDNGADDAASGVTKLKKGAGEIAAGAGTLSDSLSQVNDKLPALNDGVDRLSSGISSARSGSSALLDGAMTLEGKMPLLCDVADSLSVGLEQAESLLPGLLTKLDTLSGGLSQMADTVDSAAGSVASIGNATDLIDQAIAAIESGDPDGAVALLQGAKQYTAKAGDAGGALSSISSKLTSMSAEVDAASSRVSDMQDNVGLMADGAGSLSSGMAYLSSGISLISTNAGRLNNGLVGLDQGTATLKSSVSVLSSGSHQLAEGATKLSDGANALSGGLNTLESGMFTLTEGTHKLAVSMTEGSEELKDNTKSETEPMAEFISDPTTVDDVAYGTAETYGMGFSPFFISLSCWLGAVLMFFVIPLLPKNPLQCSRWALVFGPMPVFGIVSLLQGIVIAAGTLLVGINVNHIPLLFLMAMVLSLCFTLFIQLLNFAFGPMLGRGTAIILLIFQLCACGGTFPVELITRFFRVINPFMPFTYSVRGLKEIMFGGDMSIVFTNLAVILGLGLISLLLSLLLAHWGAKRNLGEAAE